MSNPLKAPRGTTASITARILDDGELAYDTTLDRLRVGDGITLGGLAQASAGDAALGDVASTFASGDATPSVLNNSKFITEGSTAITNFDDGVEGQTISIYRGSADIVITDNATIDPIISGNLSLTAARPSAAFRLVSGVWKQVEEAGAASLSMLPVLQSSTVAGAMEDYLDAGAFTTTGGSAARSLKERFNDEISLLDWGVVAGDSTLSVAQTNTANINLAYAYALAANKAVLWPPGSVYVAEASGSPGYCILNKGVPTRGVGRNMSVVAPQSGVGSGVDLMRITPTASADISYLPIIDLLFYMNVSGSAVGRHAIHLLTDVVTNLSGLYMRNVYCAAGNDYSLRMQNTGATNQQGVPANSLIYNCQFMEGVYATDHGDNLVFFKNVIRASGTRAGIRADAVNDGGGLAGHLIVDMNNIVASGGAFRLDGGRNVKFLRNNCEQTGGAGSNGAIVDIDGAGSAITGFNVVRDNHIAGFGSTTVTIGIRCNAVTNLVIDDNDLDAGIAIASGVSITASATGVIVGLNRISGFTAAVSNSGTGTLRCSTVPLTTVDNTVPRFDGTLGAMQSSGITISDGDVLLAVAGASNAPSLAIGSTARGFYDTGSAIGLAIASTSQWNFGEHLLATNGGKVLVGNGNASVPTLSFANYTGVGYFVTSATQMGMALNGALAIDFTTTTVSAVQNWTVLNATSIPAGGTAGAGYMFSSTANFGVFFGSGAPSLSAAKGSLYLRSDGSSTSTRAYINTDGGTSWTAITTAS